MAVAPNLMEQPIFQEIWNCKRVIQNYLEFACPASAAWAMEQF
jgi:hypothetical protein